MKSLFLAFVMTIVSAQASAQGAFGPGKPTITAVTQYANLMPPVSPGRRVQTTLKVSYSACATFSEENFEVTFEDDIVNVEVAPGTIDCMAVGRFREIEITTNIVPVLDIVNVYQNGNLVQLPVEQNFVY